MHNLHLSRILKRFHTGVYHLRPQTGYASTGGKCSLSNSFSMNPVCSSCSDWSCDRFGLTFLTLQLLTTSFNNLKWTQSATDTAQCRSAKAFSGCLHTHMWYHIKTINRSSCPHFPVDFQEAFQKAQIKHVGESGYTYKELEQQGVWCDNINILKHLKGKDVQHLYSMAVDKCCHFCQTF